MSVHVNDDGQTSRTVVVVVIVVGFILAISHLMTWRAEAACSYKRDEVARCLCEAEKLMHRDYIAAKTAKCLRLMHERDKVTR